MSKRAIAIAALSPLALLGATLPAQAADSGWAPVPKQQTVKAKMVTGRTAPGASPLRQIRSSSVRCAGTLIDRQYAYLGRTVVGELTIYTTSANRGTAIACFKHVGPTKGVNLPTSVSLVAIKSERATRPAVQVVASGRFRSWAGPAAIGGVNNKGYCVLAAGAMQYKGRTVVVESDLMCRQ
ncbi:hypothetical protein [Luteococcus peritonei]|uniref:Tat pathway signal sequence domain protein n=1 Tax=Luteococcus peritonei TaxID=88874 RepID=A0ABW4RZ22_9ACTN